MTESLSASRFYAEYAERSGTTPEALAALGQRAYQCECGDEICSGWQMLSHSEVEWDRSNGTALYVDPADNGYAPGVTDA